MSLGITALTSFYRSISFSHDQTIKKNISSISGRKNRISGIGIISKERTLLEKENTKTRFSVLRGFENENSVFSPF